MLIRKCPHCAQLIHFEPRESALARWNCAQLVRPFQFRTPGQKRLNRARIFWDRALPDPARLIGAGKVALVAAAPIAALMLLICNGFDIAIVRDAVAPFAMR